jgi:hypothetical protein
MKGPVPWRRTPSASVVKLEGVPMAVAPWIVSDGLWDRFEPLLPKRERRFRYPGGGSMIELRCRGRDPVRVAHGDRVAASAARAWLWLGLDLLPPTGRVVAGRGSGCTRCCLPSCVPPGKSRGLARSSTPATCKRKRGAPKRARARLIEAETRRSIISWSTRPGSRSPGRSRAATATTSPS